MLNPSEKPIFITGATGSVGFMLAKRLSETGEKVRAMVHNPACASTLSALPNVEIVRGDLNQQESLRGLMEGCGLVYHAGGKVRGSDRAAYEAVNLAGTKAVLNEAIRAGVERFVYVSTIGVYGLSEGQNLTEDTPWSASHSPYIATKQEAEQIVMTVGLRMPVAVARPGDIYGPQQYTWTTQFIEKINQGILMPPTDSTSGTLNLVYIDNLVDALILLGWRPETVGQAFNVVDGAPMRVSDYILTLASMAGKHPLAVPAFVLRSASFFTMASDRLHGREAMVTPDSMNFLFQRMTVSNEKLRTHLGWTPAVNREEAFRRIADWLHSAGYIK